MGLIENEDGSFTLAVEADPAVARKPTLCDTDRALTLHLADAVAAHVAQPAVVKWPATQDGPAGERTLSTTDVFDVAHGVRLMLDGTAFGGLMADDFDGVNIAALL